ncbi:hypothetical protein BMF94_2214 [Rhodotorula taiwanensis]|uniref:Uncharacterized protein n=1 Tax=Rhodotorula taiwanensis TaxID=741276 RepID=A0A2S5BDA2_9BASI|nr:hypothetical protein BMF94_2214 [Rhodotorula taiwanensis]
MSQENSGNDQPQEQQFSIQPHPATSNDPADIERQHGGLGGAPTLQHLQGAQASPFGGRGDQPHIPNQDMLNNLEEPMNRDQLHARQEELNKPGSGVNTPSGDGNAGEL